MIFFSVADNDKRWIFTGSCKRQRHVAPQWSPEDCHLGLNISLTSNKELIRLLGCNNKENLKQLFFSFILFDDFLLSKNSTRLSAKCRVFENEEIIWIRSSDFLNQPFSLFCANNRTNIIKPYRVWKEILWEISSVTFFLKH